MTSKYILTIIIVTILKYNTCSICDSNCKLHFDFEICIQRESTLDELSVALHCASLAGPISEIRLRKVWNYERCVIKKTVFKHLLPVKPQHSAFFRVTEHQVSFATLSVTWAPSWLHAASLDTSRLFWKASWSQRSRSELKHTNHVELSRSTGEYARTLWWDTGSSMAASSSLLFRVWYL